MQLCRKFSVKTSPDVWKTTFLISVYSPKLNKADITRCSVERHFVESEGNKARGNEREDEEEEEEEEEEQ